MREKERESENTGDSATNSMSARELARIVADMGHFALSLFRTTVRQNLNVARYLVYLVALSPVLSY